MAVRFDKAAARALEASYQTPEIVHQRERVLAHLPLGESTRALDVGCGVGLLTQSIAERIGPGGSVLACDRSGVMVEETQHRCAAFEQVNAFEASVGALPLADGSVDCVAITQVLLYVDDIPTALEDLHRVLAPGGVLVVIETDWRGVVLGTAYPELAEKVFQAWDAAVPNPQLPGRMHGLLVASGFDVESVEAIPVLNRDWEAANFSVPMLRDSVKLARKRGFLSDSEGETLWSEQQARGDAGEYFFCVNRFLFAARKGQP